MSFTLIRKIAFLAALSAGFAASQAQAGFVGSYGVNANSPSIVSPDNGLANATTFTVASLSTNGNATGGFIGIATAGISLSGASFTLGSTSGFNFSDGGTLGSFTQTAAAQLISEGVVGGVVQSETYYILGNYVGGPVGSTPMLSSFTISFTQNGGPDNSISASGTLTIPAIPVPEPASVAMLGLGLASCVSYGLRRRFSK